MKPANPTQLKWARELLAHEAANGKAEGRANTAAGRVHEKLHAELAPLLGDTGVHLLFARSAKLAQGEFASLAEVSRLRGSTELREWLHAQDSAVATESAAALFGTFVALIITFVGERLTTRLLLGAWPTFEGTAITAFTEKSK